MVTTVYRRADWREERGLGAEPKGWKRARGWAINELFGAVIARLKFGPKRWYIGPGFAWRVPSKPFVPKGLTVFCELEWNLVPAQVPIIESGR